MIRNPLPALALALLGTLALSAPAFADGDSPGAGKDKPAADGSKVADKPGADKPVGACAAHTATIYGAKARCWRTQKTLERADKLGITVDYHDVDADASALKYAMSNKDHLHRDDKGVIQLPLLLIDGKMVLPELKSLDAACGVKK